MMREERIPNSVSYLRGTWVTSLEKQQWGVFWSSGPFVSWANGNTEQESWGSPQTCSQCPRPPPPLRCHTSGTEMKERRTFRSSPTIITSALQRDHRLSRVRRKYFPPLQIIPENKFTAYEQLTKGEVRASPICLSLHILTQLFPNSWFQGASGGDLLKNADSDYCGVMMVSSNEINTKVWFVF